MSEYESVKEVYGHTSIHEENFSFTWRIQNFSLEDNEYLASPQFPSGQSSVPTCWLQLFPKRELINSTEYAVGIWLLIKKRNESSAHHGVTFEVSILDYNNKKINSFRVERLFINNLDRALGKFISRKSLMEHRESILPNDTLTIMCELKVTFDVKSSEVIKGPIASQACNSNSLIGRLQYLFDSGMCSDFTIKVDGEEIKVHKNILCTGSTVFNRMLNSNMQENITACLEITDFDLQTVKAMLRYIYTEQVEELTPETSLNLYSIADKYDLPALKNICVGFLSRNINVEIFCDVLVLGERHNEPELVAAAKKLFCEEGEVIQKTEQWIELCKTMRDLTLSMYQHAVSQMESE